MLRRRYDLKFEFVVQFWRFDRAEIQILGAKL